MSISKYLALANVPTICFIWVRDRHMQSGLIKYGCHEVSWSVERITRIQWIN